MYYRLAQLNYSPQGGDRGASEKIAATLQKAIELDPEFANALSYLAEIKSDLDQAEAAIDLAQRAIRAEPGSSYHRMALARALWNAREADRALEAARSALKVAETDQERGNAQRFLNFAASSPPPPVRPVSSPITQPAESDAPKVTVGAASAKGSVSIGNVGELAGIMQACISMRDDKACGKAAPLLSAQCDGKEGYACRALGSLHDGGFGVPKDKTKAGLAYDKGCRAGDQSSCARHAVLELQGFVMTQTGEGAFPTLKRLCEEKVDDACVGWALIMTSRKEWRDIPKARALLDSSCQAGNPESCRMLKSLPAR